MYPPCVIREIRAGRLQNAANMARVPFETIASWKEPPVAKMKVKRPRAVAPQATVTPVPGPTPLSHAEKLAWQVSAKARRNAVGASNPLLALEAGYTRESVAANLSKSNLPSMPFIIAVDAALERLALLKLRPISNAASPLVSREWAAMVRARRLELGMSWEALAARTGYTPRSVNTAIHAGSRMPPHRKADIEAALGLTGCGL